MSNDIGLALRAARKTSPLTFSGAYLPKKPPIDKVAAYAVLSQHSCNELAWVRFHDSNEFSDDEIRKWESEGVCAIDLGNRKYHNVEEESATEWVVNRYSIPLTSGITELVHLISYNNKTGNLRAMPFSVPFLMREFYELEDCESWAMRVIRAATDVVVAFIKVANGEAVKNLTDRGPANLTKFSASIEKPLTLGQYVNNLWLLGQTPEEIQEKVEFWQEGMRRLEERRARANAEFKSMKREEFSADGKRGIVLHTDDYFLSKAVVRSKLYAIRVTVGRDGHTTVSTNSLDVKALYRHLNQREPRRWHMNEQMGAVINGGPQYTGVTPTDIPSNKIVEMVQYYLAPMSKK